MVTALENMGIPPLQFRLDSNRPDLQKLDSLLGLLATESSAFTSQIKQLADKVAQGGLPLALKIDDVENIQTQMADLGVAEVDGRDQAEIDNSKGKGKGKEHGEKAEKLCVVCEERNVDTVLLECGHMVLCSECAPPVVQKNSCPLCRGPIARSLKVYV